MVREILSAVWADLWAPVTLPRWIVLAMAASALQVIVRAALEVF